MSKFVKNRDMGSAPEQTSTLQKKESLIVDAAPDTTIIERVVKAEEKAKIKTKTVPLPIEIANKLSYIAAKTDRSERKISCRLLSQAIELEYKRIMEKAQH
jgi:hypothetical protein